MSANAQKINNIELLDCKRSYIKLSSEHDTLKSMFADSLLKHKAEKVVWKSETKSQVSIAKKTGFWNGFKWGGGTGILVTVLILVR